MNSTTTADRVAATLLQSAQDVHVYFQNVRAAHFIARFPKDLTAMLNLLKSRFSYQSPACQLDLSATTLTTSSVSSVLDLLYLNPNVYGLTLAHYTGVTFDALFTGIHAIYLLDLSFSKFDWEILGYAHLGRLRQLRLRGLRPTEAFLTKIVAIPALQQLDFSFCEFSSAAIHALLGMHELSRFEASNICFLEGINDVQQFMYTVGQQCAASIFQGTTLSEQMCESLINGCFVNYNFCELNIRGCALQSGGKISYLISYLLCKFPAAVVTHYNEKSCECQVDCLNYRRRHLELTEKSLVFYVNDLLAVIPTSDDGGYAISHAFKTLKEKKQHMFGRLETTTESLARTLQRGDVLFDRVLDLDDWQMDDTTPKAPQESADAVEELSWDFVYHDNTNYMIVSLKYSQLDSRFGFSRTADTKMIMTPNNNRKTGISFCDFESKSPKASRGLSGTSNARFYREARELYADTPGVDVAQIAEILHLYHNCVNLDAAISTMDYVRTRENYIAQKTICKGFPVFAEYSFAFGVRVASEDEQKIRLLDEIDFKVTVDGESHILSIFKEYTELYYLRLYFGAGLQFNVSVGEQVSVEIGDCFNIVSFYIEDELVTYFREVMSVRIADFYSVPGDVPGRESVLWQIGGM